MAVLYPPTLREEVRSDPLRAAEVRCYDALARRLDDEWTVFYSVDWHYPDDRHRLQRGEADFLLLHPDLGWMVIEVKGGGVARDSETGRWSTIDRNGGRHKLKRPPLHQAERSLHALRRLLDSRIPGGEHGCLPWTWAAWLPDLTSTPDWLGPGAPAVLFGLSVDVGEPEAWLRRVFDHSARVPDRTPEVRRRVVERIVALLAPSWEITPKLAAQVAENERVIEQLTAEQAEVLRGLRANRRVLVTGGAGTGKTVLALETATSLAAHGHRTLLGCFNRPLWKWLASRSQELLAQRGVDGEAGLLLTATSIHSLAVQALKDAGMPPEDSDFKRQPFWDEELPELFLAAIEKLPDLRFQAVVVDEAQDFPTLWWAAIEELLAEPKNGVLWVFGDDNQNIYGGSHDVAAEIRGVRWQLSANLRNTQQIHACIAPLYNGDRLLPAGPDGPPVRWVNVADAADLGAEIARIIDELIGDEGLSRADIAVLTARRHDSAVLGHRIGSHRTCPAENPKPGRVILDTIHHFKGLERPVVILAELKTIQDANARELLYVGASRARQLLVVVEAPRSKDEDG